MAITLSQQGNIAVVTIERAERRNAVDSVTALELYKVFKRIDQDDAVSVAVLTGSGGNFCAGADLKAFAEGDRKSIDIDGDLGPMGPTRLKMRKPVIAAIEGYAVAGGLEMALWCDMRVAARSAKFGVFCRRFGVPLVDLGTIRLPRLIGQSRAADMILTGREVSAEEAYEFGLANRLVEDGSALSEALDVAKQIASFPQHCMRNDRLSMLAQWELTDEQAVRYEMQKGLEVISSGETLKGASAFSSGVGRHGHFEEPSNH